MPRKIIVLVILLAMLICRPVIGFAQEKELIKIGVLPIVESMALVMTATQPEIATSNFNIKFEVFSTWTALEAAYRVGMIDMMAMTAPKVLKMANSNVPVKIVMALHRNGDMLVTSFDADKKENFKGRLIGVSGNDTGQLLLLAKYMKERGIELGTDVRYIPIPQSKVLQLLSSERIQGFLFSEPTGTMAIKEGLVKKFVHGVAINRNFIDVLLVSSSNFIDDHQKEIELLVSTIKKCGRDVENDIQKSGGKQVSLTQFDILGIEPEIVQKSLSDSANKLNFSSLGFSIDELADIEQQALKLNILDTSIDLPKIVDTRFSR